VAASDEVVFAWAIGKALLVVIVSVGTLIYAAWAVPRKRSRQNVSKGARTLSDVPSPSPPT
jgi:hypothetical protein